MENNKEQVNHPERYGGRVIKKKFVVCGKNRSVGIFIYKHIL